MGDGIIEELYDVILNRINEKPEGSYVANLVSAGLDKILKKIGEEATEVVISGKAQDVNALIYEMADLAFHCLVLLAFLNISPDMVKAELRRRRIHSSAVKESNRPTE